ncbi:MAG: DUF4226 domain-containing protein [Mycobacterium sp.]|nr:DUF4226 domain-containing protein [Mycobacterium sp.]
MAGRVGCPYSRAVFPLEGPAPAAPDQPSGSAADAIRLAEAALVRQNSVTANVDLQVITAVLNAHTAHSTGAAALAELQREIEAAVATRTDLDTPAGAREFQRYLIDKMHDIRTVVEDTDLDDTSKAALAAALASLYVSSGPADAPPAVPRAPLPGLPADPPRPAAAVVPETAPPFGYPGSDAGLDAGLDPALIETGPLPADPSTAPAAAAATPPAAATPSAAPAIPSFPSLGGGGLSPLPPLAGLSDLLNAGPPDPTPEPEPEAGPQEPEPAAATAMPGTDLRGVIAAAVAGTPIPDAFGWQGITIPEPGSPVSAPLDPAQVIAGDVGIFADRHALALGNGKVLLDNQIQPIETAAGPGFIGWQHPPAPPPVPPAD